MTDDAMTFTVLGRRERFPDQPRRPKPLQWGRIWRGDLPGGNSYGPVKAVTADSEWLFVLAGDGTWSGGHLPTKTEVKAGIKTLPACIAYARSGRAQADLDLIQAHQRGEHGTRARGCHTCQADTAARKAARAA